MFQPKIEFRDPESLTPYTNNAKRHPQSQIDKLAGAIAEYGFDQPIVIDEQGIILKGHGRREASLQLGLKLVPVVVRADLSPAQKKAARIADNRIAEEGKTDYEALSLEMESLLDLDFNLSLTGFDAAEIDKFLSESQIDVSAGLGLPSGDAYQGEGDEDDEDDSSVFKSPAEKYPLSIVLTGGEMQRHKQAKELLEVKSDRDLYLKLLEMAGV